MCQEPRYRAFDSKKSAHMKSRAYVLLALMYLLVLGAGCGRPSYDLTVRVTDEGDSAIPSAEVLLEELEDIQMTDDTGIALWTDLEQELVTLVISAQGYVPRFVEVTMARGHNEEVITLEQDLGGYDVTNP